MTRGSPLPIVAQKKASYNAMNNRQKIGIVLIIIGICIPLLTLPFLSGYSKDKGLIDNLYGVGIELRKANIDHSGGQSSGIIEKTKTGSPVFSKLIPKRIPFRFILVITVIFLYMGIVRITASHRQDDSQT